MTNTGMNQSQTANLIKVQNTSSILGEPPHPPQKKTKNKHLLKYLYIKTHLNWLYCIYGNSNTQREW